jgi:DNA-binding NarL/FixJ family response regulator
VKRILIVDDSPVMREVTKRIISRSYRDCLVEDATGREDALRICNASEPDLVLIDLSIDSGKGVELARAIQDLVRNAQIVIMSEQNPETMSLLQRTCNFPCIAKTELMKEFSKFLQPTRPE